MSRFLSTYEINKKEKQLKEDLLFNASKYKEELKQAINMENIRINVDSAKKKAVMQHMDYDGFHQMVLGANIKGTKTAELLDLQPKAIIMNTVMTQKMLSKEIDILAANFVVSDADKAKDPYTAEESCGDMKEFYRAFKKIWKSKSSPEDKIEHLLKNEYFEQMINSDILEANFFLEIIFNVGSYICKSAKTMSKNEIEFLLNCLNSVIKHEKFLNLKKFIGKKQKAVYLQIKDLDFDESLTNIISSIIDSIVQ